MSPESIARKKEMRYHRALAIAATAGAIRPNGQPHTFYVKSQNGRGTYLAATPDSHPPLGVCTCPDFQSFGKHNAIPCKHIYGAHIYEQARAYVLRHMERYSLTPQHVVDMVRNPSLFREPTEQGELRLQAIVVAAAIITAEVHSNA